MKPVHPCEALELELADQAEPSAELRAHLARCPGCRALREALEQQAAELGALEDPPGFEEALAALHERVLARTTAPVRRFRVLPWAAAASFLLLAWAAWPRLHSRRGPSLPLPSQARIAPPQAPVTAIPAPAIQPAPVRTRRHAPSTAYDPVRVARRILASGSGSRTVLIQPTPQVVIYWVHPIPEASHEL
jgi:hypothetical protein